MRLLVRLGERGAADPLTTDDGADGDGQSEHVAHQVGRIAAAQPVDAEQQRDGGHDRRAKRAGRRSRRELPPRALPAAVAPQGVQPVLGDLRLHLRQLRDLVALRGGVLASQPRIAPTAARGLAFDDRLHFLRREHLALVPLVPRLSAAPKARWRLELALDRRGVARRRLARIARRRSQQFLQLRQPRFQLRDAHPERAILCLQLGDTLDVPRISRHHSRVPHPLPDGKRFRMRPRTSISRSKVWTHRSDRPWAAVNGYISKELPDRVPRRERGLRARGERDELDPVDDLLTSVLVVGRPTEVALDVAQAEERLRPNVLEPRHAREADLEGDRDVALRLLSDPPLRLRDDLDHRRTGFGYASMSSAAYAPRPTAISRTAPAKTTTGIRNAAATTRSSMGLGAVA